jgi:hypothetical protein
VWAFDDPGDGHGALHAARGGRRWLIHLVPDVAIDALVLE